MIDMQLITKLYPDYMRGDKAYRRYMLKEYLQLMILDWLSRSVYVKNLAFIGGTNLRLAKGIDRFFEELDFDCKRFSHEDFARMCNGIMTFLRRSGLDVETHDNLNDHLTVYRRTIYFPELLYKFGLSDFKEERFQIKIEGQDQGFVYRPEMVNVCRDGFFFPFPVPPDAVLCTMKLTSLLARQRGRDFYDVMYLLGVTEPDYELLGGRWDIHDKIELKQSLRVMLDAVDLELKSNDYKQLLLDRSKGDAVMRFHEFIDAF
jgi:predicted nucleotidyltransferase component of viral defense system